MMAIISDNVPLIATEPLCHSWQASLQIMNMSLYILFQCVSSLYIFYHSSSNTLVSASLTSFEFVSLRHILPQLLQGFNHRHARVPWKMSPLIPLSQACGECDACTSSPTSVTDHPPFRVVSNDPTDGLDVEQGWFTAQQIADAFAHLIPGHTDWPIKQAALSRWESLQPELGDGSCECDSEFDLEPIWKIFDDFLFLGLLRDLCRVEWVDQLDGKDPQVGRCEEKVGIRGPRVWIYVLRPSFQRRVTVQECLETLLHEMCHALFYLACQCNICDCHLNRVNGEGMRYHGPAWQSVRRTVEDTASKHFTGFSHSFFLCAAYEPDLKMEQQAECKMFHSLSRRTERNGNVLDKEKRVQRAQKKVERNFNTPEESRSDQVLDEALKYMVAVFARGDPDLEMDEDLGHMVALFAKCELDIESQ